MEGGEEEEVIYELCINTRARRVRWSQQRSGRAEHCVGWRVSDREFERCVAAEPVAAVVSWAGRSMKWTKYGKDRGVDEGYLAGWNSEGWFRKGRRLQEDVYTGSLRVTPKRSHQAAHCSKIAPPPRTSCVREKGAPPPRSIQPDEPGPPSNPEKPTPDVQYFDGRL